MKYVATLANITEFQVVLFRYPDRLIHLGRLHKDLI